jgi:hypothetical protein
MPVRTPYRFNRIVPIVAALLFFFFAGNPLHAQDDQADTLIEQVEPPVQSYDKDDDYSTSNQELPPELRNVPDSTVAKLKRDKEFAYANDDAYLQKEELEVEEDTGAWTGFFRFFSSGGVRIMMYILLAVFFIFIIYRIIVVNNLYFISSKKKLVHDDGVDEEITDENIDEKIRGAAAAGDYRLAVRYSYIKGLRLLNDKGWIRLHAQATNHDYVYQVSKYPVAGDFNFLTRVYDYVWYGEFAVNNEQYARLQTDFQKFYRAVK